MTDYGAMTDAELNRRVAEALGYRVEWQAGKVIEQGYDDYIGFHPGFFLINPHGLYVHTVGDGRPYGYETEAQAWDRVPRWSNDVGAAMFLLKDVLGFTIQSNEDEDELRYFVQIRFVNPQGLRGGCQTYNESLPRAIAECWLMLKEGT